MKLPKISYRAVAIIAIAVSIIGLIASPVSAAVSPSGTYIQGQHFGGNFLSNQTSSPQQHRPSVYQRVISPVP